MTHQNLLLSEKAIKAHSKRLQKELQQINKNITLGQVQNIFAKSLGFNNFYDLKNILTKNNKNVDNNITYKNLINTSKDQISINNIYLKACNDGDLDLVKLLLEDNNIINKPELKCKDFHGNINGAIYQACWSGNLELLKYLLEDIKINVEEDVWLFFYCRKKDVFKYMSIYLNVRNQKECFINKLKRVIIYSPFYDYCTFREILNLNVLKINKDEMNLLLYNIIIKNNGNHKIIQHLIKLGANLYCENNDIFLTFMEKLTELEKSSNDDKNYNKYIKDKIQYIIDMLNYLDNEYNYFKNYNIEEVIKYFQQHPDELNNEWKNMNNSYVKKLIS